MCLCGHAIADQTDLLPYKAEFYPDEDWERCFLGIRDEFLAAVAAREQRRRRGIDAGRRPLSRVYPPGKDFSGYVADIIIGKTAAYKRKMCECDQCGRLWLQTGRQTNRYVS